VINASALLAHLPAKLRQELLDSHREIVRNYVERRWEPAELNGGKLCEVVFTILDGATSGSFAASASKPSNMVDACRALEQRIADPNRPGDRSLRVLIPRLLPFLYEIRNNRGVGHIGAEVNPNHEDAEEVMASANWLMAELVRIFHNVSLADAQTAVDALVEKRHPIVWEIEGTKRVLDPNMKAADRTLVLLYSEPSWAPDDDLFKWVEYRSLTNYRREILLPLHTERKIEYDVKLRRAMISPRGIQFAEENLLPK
jgi:hypothetical protein